MRIEETKNKDLEREYKITVPALDIQKKKNAKIDEIKTQVKLPGFRPGKVPAAEVDRRYGQSIEAEIIEKIINESSTNLIRDKELRPSIMPDIKVDESFKPGGDLNYTFSVEVLPDLGNIDLKKIKSEDFTVDIGDKEIEERLAKLRAQHAQYKKTEDAKHKVAKTDQVVLDFLGKIDNVPFEGGAAENHELVIGSNSFIDNFEDQLVGLKVGAKKTVKVKFPDNYQKMDLSGRKAEFDIEIKEIRTATLPELNDEFAKKVNAESIDKLKEKEKGFLEEQIKVYNDNIFKNEIIENLLKACSFPLPKKLFEKECEAIYKEKFGELKDYDEKKNDKKVKKEVEKTAEKKVRNYIIFSSIARNEKISAEVNEVQEKINAMIANFPDDLREKAAELYYRKEHVGRVQDQIIEEKLFAFIKENITLKKKQVSLADLEKQYKNIAQ